MEKCEAISSQFTQLFDQYPNIDRIAIWAGEYLNDEDILINDKSWEDYLDKDSEKILDIIMDAESVLNRENNNPDLLRVKSILGELNIKYNTKSRDNDFIRATQWITPDKINLNCFIDFYGKRAWKINGKPSMLFEIHRNGNVQILQTY